jgi:EAL domain-containing protein (putative c-di-GMP-specific phosphodiesterase class I)/ActR/RegA family two-component response regulator
MARPHPAASIDPDAESIAGGPRGPVAAPLPSILLLDDDEQMLEVASRMLRSMGYARVTTVTSTTEALLHLEHEPLAADVLICDLNMPGMDGIEFLQMLRAGPFRGSIILLSGASQRIMNAVRQLLQGARLTILGTLNKPASRADLGRMLDLWKPPLEITSQVGVREFSGADVHRAARERQWILHYQPQVDLRSGALVGLEALVRWQHPELGLLFPDRFIALAEESGAIEPLTDWVVQEALRHGAEWQRAGLELQMAVNISMECLQSPDFERRFTALVQSAAARPETVTLEITESQLMGPTPVPLTNLARLGLHHFGLAIDDFGTGHSSLAQLRDLPFTELKVDRGFVRGAASDPILRPILEGSLNMAEQLGLRSVAEGVETEDDWHVLRALRCDVAQGYFIGRPMPGERVAEWLKSWQQRSPGLLV